MLRSSGGGCRCSAAAPFLTCTPLPLFYVAVMPDFSEPLILRRGATVKQAVRLFVVQLPCAVVLRCAGLLSASCLYFFFISFSLLH